MSRELCAGESHAYFMCFSKCNEGLNMCLDVRTYGWNEGKLERIIYNPSKAAGELTEPVSRGRPFRINQLNPTYFGNDKNSCLTHMFQPRTVLHLAILKCEISVIAGPGVCFILQSVTDYR